MNQKIKTERNSVLPIDKSEINAFFKEVFI
jgi:hypothetical protein